jgi:hypothetical protein
MDIVHHVSWQSAFGSLPPLALSIMLQPYGRTCCFPYPEAFWYRSSPLICAFDAIWLLCHFVFYLDIFWADKVFSKSDTSIQAGIRWAARATIQLRFQHVPQKQVADGFEALQQSRLTRMLSFVLGTLSQAVKLFGMSGIPWTKAWGAMYLVDFLIIELLAYLAGPDNEKENEEIKWMILTRGVPRWSPVTTQACQQCAVMLQVLVLSWAAGDLLNQTLKHSFNDVHDGSDLWGLVPKVMLGGFILASSWISWMACTIIPWRLATKEDALASKTFCFFFCIVALWYAFVYNPTGTFKPAWTDVF